MKITDRINISNSILKSYSSEVVNKLHTEACKMIDDDDKIINRSDCFSLTSRFLAWFERGNDTKKRL